MRVMREEVEATLARNVEAGVRHLVAAMAVLGAELVGSDTYARAGELGLLCYRGWRLCLSARPAAWGLAAGPALAPSPAALDWHRIRTESYR